MVAREFYLWGELDANNIVDNLSRRGNKYAEHIHI
jgi:hypothetical protein